MKHRRLCGWFWPTKIWNWLTIYGNGLKNKPNSLKIPKIKISARKTQLPASNATKYDFLNTFSRASFESLNCTKMATHKAVFNEFWNKLVFRKAPGPVDLSDQFFDFFFDGHSFHARLNPPNHTQKSRKHQLLANQTSFSTQIFTVCPKFKGASTHTKFTQNLLLLFELQPIYWVKNLQKWANFKICFVVVIFFI